MIDPFEPIDIGNMRVRNRFMRSATWDSSATGDGEVTDISVRIIRDIAAGGMGLIVAGFAFVSEEGKAARMQLGVAEDRHVPGLRRLADVAHEHGSRIALQIAHSGTSQRYLRDKTRVAVAPSVLESIPTPHRALTRDEIRAAIDDFATAAGRAKEAGFDALQLHGAHGYLMSQFLSPKLNLRTDEWGGSPENRRRFHVEALRAVRRAVGPGFPVLIKMGLRDGGEDGLTLEEGIIALQALVSEGLAAVEISVGAGGSAAQTDKEGDIERAYFRAESAAAKRAVGVKVALAGGIRSLKMAQDILDANDADMISMSRPLIREPQLIERWAAGDARPATCISCNKCFNFGVRGEPLECGEDRRLLEEAAKAAR